MGLPPGLSVHARHGARAAGGHHRRQAAQLVPGRKRFRSRLIATLAIALTAILAGAGTATAADPLRVAFFNTELSRRGPGLLLRDILRQDPQARAVAAIVARIAPDILVLAGIDYDADGHALSALVDLVAQTGPDYPARFALRPNSGMATGLDLDGDGRTGGPRDAQGYGRFAGQGGLAILSRWPVDRDGVRDLSTLPWRDLPGAAPPRRPDGTPYPGPDAWARQRLSSVAHWDVPLRLPGGRSLRLLVFHATPPVFDGPEDRNGRRNRDEAALWLRYLEGALDLPAPEGPLILAGDANLDPRDGEGRRDALTALLAHPRLTDPQPRSAGGRPAARRDGGANLTHRGDPALDTVDWPDGDKDGNGPGNLRVDYLLPSRDLTVRDAGVFWPAPDSADAALLAFQGVPASRHRLVWVDVELAH